MYASVLHSKFQIWTDADSLIKNGDSKLNEQQTGKKNIVIEDAYTSSYLQGTFYIFCRP